MDTKSQQVANELVEAGLTNLGKIEGSTWHELNIAFLGLGDGLATAHIATFARGLDSAQGDTPDAKSLREMVAVDLHRDAAAIVTAGARVAVIAFQLEGKSDDEAIAAANWRLRSAIAEDSVPGESGEELVATAHRNYVLAASDLYRLSTEDDPGGIDGFAGNILDNVVSFGVAAAAEARAVEDSTG